MNRINRGFLRLSFGRACAIVALSMVLPFGAASAQESRDFNVPAQDAASALRALALQADFEILIPQELVQGKKANAIEGRYAPEEALHRMLQGTGLKYRATGPDTYVVEEGELTLLPFVNGAAESTAIAQQGATQASPASAADVDPGVSAPGEQTTAAVETTSRGGIEEIIVTGQKKEERLQDVPIAISAFSAEDLSEQKIEGGFDLLKAIPNVTFSKSNFSSYNFSIRGIGTKAISATTDPGVAIAFNNTALIQNRLFEQEYFDVERVEVLRGPQGTLFGRNATAGVVNVISSKPDFDEFEGNLKLEGGNYDTKRIVAMGNAPIIDNVLALRIAGAMTQREGYDFNEITGNPVNGRDLWSGRVTLGFNPSDRVRTYLLWERFEEDDDRSRTGKQLCHRDPGPEVVGSTVLLNQNPTDFQRLMRPAAFSQGCKPGSLYDAEAFGTPNGLALPFVFGMLSLRGLFGIGYDPSGDARVLVDLQDPYGGMMQSRDLRKISSFRDPRYQAEADLLELNFEADLSDSLLFVSQTAYNEDSVYSFQDFNRFNTLPVFTDTATLTNFDGSPSAFAGLAPGGVFCDPQLGCSDRLAGFDISQARGRQFSQEFRLQSSNDGAFNFSLGANYTSFKTLVDYYVFYNLITAYAQMPPFNTILNSDLSNYLCGGTAFAGNQLPGPPPTGPLPMDDPRVACPYVDPNPIESIDGEGHNYFRSKNPYELRSTAAFGEIYWNVRDDLKLTAGLRYTDDLKTFTPVPSQILLAQGIIAGGTVNKGYPEKPAIELHWGEFTGRLGLDWKTELPFTDETLLYAFYSRGYKGGGANPPSPGFATGEELIQLAESLGVELNALPEPGLKLNSVEYGRTFAPEFVNAFEVGAKNKLLDGALIFNTTAFFYDYTDYQVSQIRDRTAVNENFDAKIWGLEFEALFSPTPDLKINANLGYLDTAIADGESSVDLMNRTQGNPGYVLMKPWVQLPSNCVVPVHIAEGYLARNGGVEGYWSLCGGVRGLLDVFTQPVPDSLTGQEYDPANYPELNGGAGLKADLGGNELPNSPHWTANLGVQYGMDFAGAWRATGRIDGYWQGESWARAYNADPYDKLRSWYNLNLSTWVEQLDWGLKVEVYVKNLLDDTPITDAFLNSDDTALTTNVFVLDPRLIGVSIRKDF